MGVYHWRLFQLMIMAGSLEKSHYKVSESELHYLNCILPLSKLAKNPETDM